MAYLDAMRDWVEHGADSRWALSPDQVVDASRPRPLLYCMVAGPAAGRWGRPGLKM